MDDGPLFMKMDAFELGDDLVRVLCRTVRERGRIEITNCDGGSCVMISKAELDSLEKALEILSNTNAGQALHQAVERLAALAGGPIPALA